MHMGQTAGTYAQRHTGTYIAHTLHTQTQKWTNTYIYFHHCSSKRQSPTHTHKHIESHIKIPGDSLRNTDICTVTKQHIFTQDPPTHIQDRMCQYTLEYTHIQTPIDKHAEYSNVNAHMQRCKDANIDTRLSH